MKTFLLLLVGMLLSSGLYAQLTGVKTINPSGSGANNYLSVAQAVLDLNAVGVGTGGVTFEVAAGVTFNETASIIITTTTSDATKPIIFKRAGTGANPIIRAKVGTIATGTFGNDGDAVIKVVSTDYITFDGLEFKGQTGASTNLARTEYGILLAKTATDACKNITVKNCIFSLDKASSYTIGIYQSNLLSAGTAATVTSEGGRSENNVYVNNTFTGNYNGIYLNSFSHSTAPFNFLDNNNIIANNLVENFGGSSVVSYGIYGVNQDSLIIRGNTLNGGSGQTTTLYAIYTTGGTNTTLTANSNTVTLTGGSTSSNYGVYLAGSATGTNSVVTMDSNIVQNSSFTSTSALFGIYAGVSSKTLYVRHNKFLNNTVNGTVYGVYVGAGSTITNAFVHNNIVQGSRRSSATGSGTYNGIYMTGYLTAQVYNNRVSDVFSKAGHTGSHYGYYDFASGAGGSLNFYNNTIDSIYTRGTGVVWGAYFSNGATTNRNIYSNKVTRLYSQGGLSGYGLYLGSGDTTHIYKNEISQIRLDSARSLTVAGIYLVSGAGYRVYNNMLHDYSAPNAFASANNASVVRGFWINSTDATVYNNSLYMAGTSTTTNANGFGADGIFVGTTPTNIDFRNNLIINKMVPVAPNKSTAIRRSATSLSGINSLMNNNIYYTSLTPSSATPIYWDGTNLDTTIDAYKNRLAPAESNAVYEDVPYLNTINAPFDLHLNPNTQTRAESGASVEALVTDDYDGNARSTSTPDVGADEGTFTAVPGDFIAPVISNVSITPNTYQCNALPHTITATITDAGGVANARILWTKAGVTQTPINMTRGASNVWTGTIPAQYSTTSSIEVKWNLSASDSAATPNTRSYIGGTYKDADLYIDAGYKGGDTVNVGSTVQFSAVSSLDKFFKITEFNFFNYTGGCNSNGSQCTWPTYLNTLDYDDNIEITNLSTSPKDLSGHKIVFEGPSSASYTFPAGTVVPGRGVVILHMSTGGPDDPANLIFHIPSGGFLPGSGTSMGIILRDAGNAIVDVIATNSYTFGTANGVTSADWSGPGISSPSGIAGATLQGADVNGNANWVTGSTATPVSIGFINPSLPVLAPTAIVSWTTSANATLSATNIANPTTTFTSVGTHQFIVSITDAGCTNRDTVTVYAKIPQKPVANFSVSSTTANVGGSPTSVDFTDLSLNTPDKWKWVFTPNTVTYMNNTTDSSQNPRVQFTGKGPYTVKLTASNAGGIDDTIRTNLISTIVSYCPSAATNTADEDISNVSITDIGTGIKLLDNGVDTPFLSRSTNTKFYTNWHDSTNVVVPSLSKGSKYLLNVSTSYTGTSTYSHWKTVYIDFNGNGSFLDAGERFDMGNTVSPVTASTFRKNTIITIPCTADTGLTRMRVLLYESQSAAIAPCGTPNAYGETEDYKIRILPTQLLYDSSVAVQPVLADVQPNTTNNLVAQIKVVANGCDGNLPATNFNISMTGTTNLADVANAKLWYTGSSATFAATTQYDVTKTASATLSFTGNQALLADTNYFWLTYDLATNATLGNSIDAVVNSVTVGGTAQVPSITSPVGSRLINFPATVVSNVLEQNAGAIEKGTNNNTIVTGIIKMSPTGAAVPLTQVKVALTGVTRKADIKDVKVYYTGASKVLNPATATQFDSTRTILTDTITFTGNQMIPVDTNYLWVTYSIKDTAIVGNFVDAEVLSYTINGLTSVPAVTNPAGRRKIINQYCPATATNTADEDIGKFVFGSFSIGVDTPIASNPASVNMYTNLTNLTGVIGQKAVTTPISVSLINSSQFIYTTSINVFIDYNQNGTFDLPDERVFKAIAANNLTSRTVSGNIIIPINVPTGPTRMRVIANETTVADLNPCANFTWGEVEDYTVNIIPQPPGDYYPPDFISKTITPAGGACAPVAHTVSVVVTDTVGVDTVYMDYAIANVAQPRVAMTAGANNTYSYTIPAQGSNSVSYSFSAVDVSANRNRSVYAGGTYADDQLRTKLVSTPDGYIGVGGTYQLGAFISNATKLGNGTTTSTGPFSPYYTTWWGNRQQYLITAAELAAGGYVPGAITSLGLDVGTVSTTLALTNFTISMGHSSLTAMTSNFVTGLTPVYTNASYTILPNTRNTHTFTSPFIWDGVSNIIIETCFNNAAWNGSQVIQYTTTPHVSCLYSAADNSTVCGNATGTTGSNRPNFFIGQPISVTYSWTNPTNGGLSATNIPNPTATPTGGLGVYPYIVNINDGTCTIADTINVNVIAPPTVNLGPNRILCTGSTITLDAANAGSTFLWNTGATTQTIDVTVGATYTVAVTNRAGLIGRDTIVITQVLSPTASLGADTVYTCTGTNTTLDAGNAGATYLWSNGATTQTVAVNAAGVYTVAVTNSNGCTTVDSVRVLNYQAPVVNIGPDLQICGGTPVVCDAGNPGSQYLWSNGATTQTITVTQPGTYSVAVTNLDGCVGRDTMVISSKPLPVVSLGADKSKCPADSVTLDAGAGFTTYSWNTGATTQSIRTPNAGTYVVTVTNADGCSAKDTIVVTNNAVPQVNLGLDRDICTSDTITLDAGNPGSTYLWSNGATTQTIKVNLAGTYSVSVTNSFGCTSSDAVVFTNKPVPVSTFSVDTSNGQSVVFLASSTAGLQFAWNFGDPTSAANTSQLANPTHVFTSPGIYSVTLTVTNVATGCRSTTVQQVTVTGLGNDFAEVFKLGAAPNPFAGNTMISYVLPENANSVSMEIYDMIGRKVASITEGEFQAAGTYQFNYKNEDLQTSSGVYMVRLTVDGKVAYIRIVDIAKK